MNAAVQALQRFLLSSLAAIVLGTLTFLLVACGESDDNPQEGLPDSFATIQPPKCDQGACK